MHIRRIVTGEVSEDRQTITLRVLQESGEMCALVFPVPCAAATSKALDNLQRQADAPAIA